MRASHIATSIGIALLLVTTTQIRAQAPPDIAAAGPNAPEIRAFLEAAEKNHGVLGARAARFLVAGMPAQDLRNLASESLLDNLALALQARQEFPWARDIPEDLFLNDVLPYASLDEPRHPWRQDLLEKARPLVAGCTTTTEAAQALNRQLFKLVNVHYSRERKRANQSPRESIEQGKASCTGLSILLVDACRAVGVPARIAGTPNWFDKRGNHTWVEIWDGTWHFTGADEYDPKGLDRGWFKNDAAKARSDPPEHAIYATSWKKTGTWFPLVWNRSNRSSVSAIDVTTRYAASPKPPPDHARISLRVLKEAGGERLLVSATARDADGKLLHEGSTRAGHADWNDLLTFPLEPGRPCTLHLEHEGVTKILPLQPHSAAAATLELTWDTIPPSNEVAASHLAAARAYFAIPPSLRPELIPDAFGPATPLDREDAESLSTLIWTHYRKELADTLRPEMEAKAIKHGDVTLRFKERTFGEPPASGHSLFISLHGGGGAPTRVNDRQWRNQVGLYEPTEGIYVAPRAPTDTWNLWHEAHIDPLFDRLIAAYVTLEGVDPDRVYLLGYSAGGDGVYQLAPRMADRFAAASMMAGHPNEASPLNLRNLPFAIFMGGKDTAYKRNEVAAQWGAQLDALRVKDPEGYPHLLTIYPECAHWMNRQDRVALPWMSSFTRTPWPTKVVWFQDDVTHSRFYWLALPDTPTKGLQITAEVEAQTIRIQAPPSLHRLTLRLSDFVLDLDKPIQVLVNDTPLHDGPVARSLNSILRSLQGRPDPRLIASAHVELSW